MLRQCTILVTLLVATVTSFSFIHVPKSTLPQSKSSSTARYAEDGPVVVEVCGFKDCKRSGGGPRLEKMIGNILEERELAEGFQVSGCDCQGECGYGPNVLVNGKLINGVRGVPAVESALGIPSVTVMEEEA